MSRVCVFDTGALIALERRDLRMSKTVMRLRESSGSIIVPTPVLGEWWKGRSDWKEKILAAVIVQPLDARLAKTAGEATAATRGATLVDAVVMASAARAGAIVYTSDVDDLTALQAFFPGVRVLSVTLALLCRSSVQPSRTGKLGHVEKEANRQDRQAVSGQTPPAGPLRGLALRHRRRWDSTNRSVRPSMASPSTPPPGPAPLPPPNQRSPTCAGPASTRTEDSSTFSRAGRFSGSRCFWGSGGIRAGSGGSRKLGRSDDQPGAGWGCLVFRARRIGAPV